MFHSMLISKYNNFQQVFLNLNLMYTATANHENLGIAWIKILTRFYRLLPFPSSAWRSRNVIWNSNVSEIMVKFETVNCQVGIITYFSWESQSDRFTRISSDLATAMKIRIRIQFRSSLLNKLYKLKRKCIISIAICIGPLLKVLRRFHTKTGNNPTQE
jgi:hypothetical protein